MKDLMRLIEQESYQVSDPVTDFLQCLFTNYDFDGAQQKLQECEQVRIVLACLHRMPLLISTHTVLCLSALYTAAEVMAVSHVCCGQ